MHRGIARGGGVLVALALIASPVATHLAPAGSGGAWLLAALVAVQAAAAGWMAQSMLVPRMLPRLFLPACLFTFTLAWALQPGPVRLLAACVPHTVIYTTLLALFAGSLRRGHEPVITIVARAARGALSATLLQYTRSVTWAWCGFFALQLLISAVLWLLAPRAWWQDFVTLGTLPLVLLMFAAEFSYRAWRHGIHAPAGRRGWRQALFAVRQLGLAQQGLAYDRSGAAAQDVPWRARSLAALTA